MGFKNFKLDKNIVRATEACGYKEPTPIQKQSIPVILSGKDIVASAETGSGKTASYVLPALNLLCSHKKINKTRILILAPTRELAGQITRVIDKYARFIHVNTVSLVGGMAYHQQQRKMRNTVDIIIATPGRLMDYMQNKRLDLSGIEMLILDEADRMLDMGFISDVKKIVKATPSKRQTLLFSATADDKLMSVLQHLLKNPVRIDISEDKIAPKLIKQEMCLAKDAQHKKQFLQHLIEYSNIYKAIIFTATKRHADKLAKQLVAEGHEAAPIHGDLRQNVRTRTLDKFRRGKIQFLVATDVAARGIDVKDISHIINYDLPRAPEDYVHRIGRTGRAGKEGIAISFVLPSDSMVLRKIEKYIGIRLPRLSLNIK